MYASVARLLHASCLQEGDFPWRHSFCAWTMSCEHPTVMVVNDAQQDSRCAMALPCCKSSHKHVHLLLLL